MALELRGVHQFAKVPGQNTFRLNKTNAYVRLSRDGLAIIVQGGKLYTEGGAEFKAKDIPEWYAAEVARLDPTVRAECGIKDLAGK